MIIRSTARAINRPLLIAGIERRMLGMAFIISVVAGANGPRLAGFPIFGFVVFFALIALAKFATRRDDRLLLILPSVWRQKAVYDPSLRAPFRMEIVE